jgi:hypothetical protein
MDRITGQIVPLYFFNPVAGELNPLHLTVRLDGEIQYDQAVIRAETFEYTLADTDGTHTLEFELSGKTDQHTVLNDQGEIDRNSCVSIRNFQFNDVAVNNLLYKVAEYQHSITEPFNGSLGYNGRACIEFTTPVDMWLFENL